MWQLKLSFKEKNISLKKLIWTYKKGYNFAKILIWVAKHPQIYILLPLKYHFEKKNYKKDLKQWLNNVANNKKFHFFIQFTIFWVLLWKIFKFWLKIRNPLPKIYQYI